MKIHIPSQQLKAAVDIASAAVSRRGTLAILSNVHLDASFGAVTVTGTDLDLIISRNIPCEVEQPGKTTIPAKRLGDLLSNVTTADVTLTADKNHVAKFDAGQYQAKLLGLDASDFPLILAENFTPTIPSLVFTAGELRSTLGAVLPAVSTDETRPQLGGVLLEIFGGKISWVGCNGILIAIVTTETTVGETLSPVLPRKFVDALLRALPAEDGALVTLDVSSEVVRVEASGVTIHARLSNLLYPKFRQLIPSEKAGQAEIDRAKFLAESRRIDALGSDANGKVWPVLSFDSGLTMQHDCMGYSGLARTALDATIFGEPVSVTLDNKLLQAALGHISEEKVSVEWTRASNPIVFRAGNFFALINPVRLK